MSGYAVHHGRYVVTHDGWTLHVDHVPDDRILDLVVDAMRRARLTPSDTMTVVLHVDECDTIPTAEIHHAPVPHLRGETTTVVLPRPR